MSGFQTVSESSFLRTEWPLQSPRAWRSPRCAPSGWFSAKLPLEGPHPSSVPLFSLLTSEALYPLTLAEFSNYLHFLQGVPGN